MRPTSCAAHRSQGSVLPPPCDGADPTCHFAALVDDFSRYLLAIRAIPTRDAISILDTLAEAIELCGVPLALMSDNGTPFVTIVRTMLSRFGAPWPTSRSVTSDPGRYALTNGKIEAFWRSSRREVLDRQHLSDLAAAEAAVTGHAGLLQLPPVHGEIGWHTPAERFDGTLLSDRGFEHVPALAPVADVLAPLQSRRHEVSHFHRGTHWALPFASCT